MIDRANDPIKECLDRINFVKSDEIITTDFDKLYPIEKRCLYCFYLSIFRRYLDKISFRGYEKGKLCLYKKDSLWRIVLVNEDGKYRGMYSSLNVLDACERALDILSCSDVGAHEHLQELTIHDVFFKNIQLLKSDDIIDGFVRRMKRKYVVDGLSHNYQQIYQSIDIPLLDLKEINYDCLSYGDKKCLYVLSRLIQYCFKNRSHNINKSISISNSNYLWYVCLKDNDNTKVVFSSDSIFKTCEYVIGLVQKILNRAKHNNVLIDGEKLNDKFWLDMQLKISNNKLDAFTDSLKNSYDVCLTNNIKK